MGKKIIIVCNVYPPHFIGGAELIAHYQAKKMKEMGHDVIIFAGDSEADGKRYDLHQETYDGLLVYRVRLQSEDYSSHFINFFHHAVHEHFTRLLDDFSPDVIHFHNLMGLSAALIHLAARKGIKTVLTLHDHWGFCLKNTLVKREEEICPDYSQCEECMPFIHDEGMRGIPIFMRKDFLAMQFLEVDAFICPSRYLAEVYIKAGMPKEKFKVIGYGIDVERFSRVSKEESPGRLRFTFVGYLGWHKGIHIILNALSQIDLKEHFRINLVGIGSEMENYKQWVKEMGLQNTVRFWGKIDNSHIEEVYRETDVLLLASVWPENEPVTIMEAMAARTPVIASRIGGIPELVEDGKTGYLFEAGNANQLAQMMRACILNPSVLEIFGENGYRKILNQTFDNQVRQIIQVYEENASSQKRASEKETLILCVGKHVNPECSQAIKTFKKRAQGDQYYFVKSEWVEEDQFLQAKLLWVVDDKTSLNDVIVGLQYGIPLLVPENNMELKSFCRSVNCGLYYHDGLEAEACLEYLLLQSRETASVMGQNGYHRWGEISEGATGNWSLSTIPRSYRGSDTEGAE